MKNWHKRVYLSSLDRANRFSLPFDITPEFVLSLYRKQNGKCFWFGVDLKSSRNQKDPQIPTLDRIDCKGGYTKNNVVLACFAANIGRNTTTPRRFKEFVKLVKGSV